MYLEAETGKAKVSIYPIRSTLVVLLVSKFVAYLHLFWLQLEDEDVACRFSCSDGSASSPVRGLGYMTDDDLSMAKVCSLEMHMVMKI